MLVTCRSSESLKGRLLGPEHGPRFLPSASFALLRWAMKCGPSVCRSFGVQLLPGCGTASKLALPEKTNGHLKGARLKSSYPFNQRYPLLVHDLHGSLYWIFQGDSTCRVLVGSSAETLTNQKHSWDYYKSLHRVYKAPTKKMAP